MSIESSRQESSGECGRDSEKVRMRPSSAPGMPSRRQAPVCHFLEAKLLTKEPRNNKIGLIE